MSELTSARRSKSKTSNFSAEYGRNAGAAINVVTPLGAMIFTARLRVLRNDKLDARSFFSPVDRAAVQQLPAEFQRTNQER